MALNELDESKPAWFDRLLFPRNRLLDIVVILCLSVSFSYALTGRQIFLANWGVIDDHEVFTFLGPDLHLPASEIWSTLVGKTEFGQWTARFRPALYLFKVIEASLFGDNVHLWYLVNTICFAIFLASIWWTIFRFVGVWLGGALTASIAMLALWSDVWSRLGPSEIFGAALVGVMIFAADVTLCSRKSLSTKVGAILLTLAAVLLAGMKETFLPLALAGPVFVFILASTEGRVPVKLSVALVTILCACLVSIVFVIAREMRAFGGVDFYGKPVGVGATLLHGIVGVFDGLLRTWWLWVLPIVLLRMLKVLPPLPLSYWIRRSAFAFSIYVFIIVMYAAQCGLYRMSFPHNSRYDFPAMLLVPLTGCVLACEVSSKLREYFSARVVNYAQLTAAAFLVFALANAYLGTPPVLALAVKNNIEATSVFYSEVERIARTAKGMPNSPIFLEGRSPRAYEPLFSVAEYLQALGVQNPIAVRVYRDERFNTPLYNGLEQQMLTLQDAGTGPFTALKKISTDQPCLSVGIYGPPASGCSPFQIEDDKRPPKH